VQDLIQLHGASQQWQAADPALGHKTGRLDTDGWLCQVGIDAPNLHMIYGPYVTTLPAGDNTAQFRLSIDDNTANNDDIVTLDVNDSTTGQVLASQVVTRTQFSVAGQYTNFSLPFSIPADNHSIELRVFWYGAAYTKVNWVGVTRSQADDELVLFASLKGIVNAKQPRIFSYEGDAFAEGPYTWLKSLGLQYTEISDNWSLIAKYQSEIAGILVYDNSQPDTINLATTLAGSKKALLAAPSLVARLTAAPYNFPILLDFRGKFTDKLSVYQSLLNDYWPSLPHRLAFGLNPIAVRASVREYATAVGAAAVWLDPTVASEQPLLDQLLSSMDPGSVWMGWWPSEGTGVTEASKYGVATVASDYSTNLTLHSGMPRTIRVPAIPAKPSLQNKIFVGFILSDGDNLQYVEHLERKLWNDAGRGKVPMGWTMSPAMVDAMPGALAYYWSTATPNDTILSGPSGYGYTYPNLWANAAQLDQFVTRTEQYNEQAGFRMITVWNTITGGINANVGDSYAKNATSLLGVTAQNTGGPLTIYDNALPGLPLSCNYCTGEQAMKDFIATASQGWDGNEPRFVMIQAQPWQNVTPTSFQNVAASLDANHVVVRPDHLFELLREANGLPVNPIHSYTITASADANGTISPSGPVAVNQNADQAFGFTPSPGYSVAAVSVDGVTSVATAYTFFNVTGDHTIHVSFTNGTGADGGTADGGVVDAGAGESGGVDAGSSDAGTGRVDASVPPADSGASDGNSETGGGTAGCSCRVSQSPASTPTGLAVFGLLALARRRRSRSAQG
jgi:MYXO-CTERM domain-containing protein